jgi:transcription initiation factor TFIIIB Brf1 subunit/transcription initiation factor TFIIB
MTETVVFEDIFKKFDIVVEHLYPQELHKCSECHGNIISVKGVDTCDSCGTIFGNSIDCTPEWRNDSEKGDDKSRCGMPVNNMMPVSSHSVVIHGAPNKQINKVLGLAFLWNAEPYAERALKDRFNNMYRKCKKHSVSDAIIEYGQSIYYDLIKELLDTEICKTKRGYNNEGLQAAAIYQAFQDDGRPKTYKEIATIFDINSLYVSNGIKIFRGLMNKTQKCSYEIKSSCYLDYIVKYSDILGLHEGDRTEVIRVANLANDLKILDNNTPVAVVAGCIYYVIIISGKDIISKMAIERACKVSIPTINKVSEKLLNHFNIINIK